MSNCKTHGEHDHKHSNTCGHTAVQHGDHVDYLHDGHLHHQHGDHVDEHTLDGCSAGHTCGSHDAGHKHGAGCGHEAVPHGDHTCYIVDGHLHHHHDGHCDDHGKVKLA